jgi:TonB-dependent SusC/RagA subfamily outer membrane receptor
MKRDRFYKWQRSVSLLLFFILSSAMVKAQVSVSGTVKGADDLGLPGVNVTIKGTTTGTITDLDGNYQLEVPSSESIIVFSMVGMLTEERVVGDHTVLDMVMVEDLVGLDEIVVVGYGTMKKSDVTGAIVSMKDEDLTQVKTTNVIESLQGKAAGVDISRTSGEAGSDFSIKIRGERSLSGNNDPLYIVDGIQYGSGVDINPSDIASIEILKDVSSTAIYGSKGANGVVIITTKKGSEGKAKVSFSMYHGWNKPLGELPYMDRNQYLSWKEDLSKFREYYSTGEWPEGTFGFDTTDVERVGIANGTDTRWIDEVRRTGQLHGPRWFPYSGTY